jgi:hypothetical protein
MQAAADNRVVVGQHDPHRLFGLSVDARTVPPAEDPQDPRGKERVRTEGALGLGVYLARMSGDRAASTAVEVKPPAGLAGLCASLITCRPEDTLSSLARTLVAQEIHAIVLAPARAEALIIIDLELVRAALIESAWIQVPDNRGQRFAG